MTQIRDSRIAAEAMVRSRAWRMGYESYRLGEAPEFVGRGDKTLTYEYGRLTAAYLRGRRVALPRVPVSRPTRDDLVPTLAAALLDCVRGSGDADPRGS